MGMTIGIGGVSRAGKSTLASFLKTHYESQGYTVEVISQDDYARPEDLIPRIRDRIDWEHPDSIDFIRLNFFVKQAIRKYEVVIVEGLFAFYDQEIASQYDKRIYLEIDKSLFLDRKAADTRWGDEPAWFMEHIWESFLTYGRVDKDEEGYLRLSGREDADLNILSGFLEARSDHSPGKGKKPSQM